MPVRTWSSSSNRDKYYEMRTTFNSMRSDDDYICPDYCGSNIVAHQHSTSYYVHTIRNVYMYILK